MPSYELIIEPAAPSQKRTRPARAPAKTRQFRAQYLAHIVANDWWSGGQAITETTRPVWLMLAGTERAIRPVIANLQTGHRAMLRRYHDSLGYDTASVAHLELLKSAGYRMLWQRLVGGPDGPLATVTAYLPELFVLDPGLIDPAGVQFVALTPQWWAQQQLAQLRADTPAWHAIQKHIEALARMGPLVPRGQADSVDALLDHVAQAVHSVTFIERRTTRPLPPTPAFALQLFLAGLQREILTVAAPTEPGQRAPSRSPTDPPDPTDRWAWARHLEIGAFAECQTATVGLAPPVGCRCTHATLDAFLAAEVERYFAAQAHTGQGPNGSRYHETARPPTLPVPRAPRKAA
jgi:hypothetical protein